jgi:undecaprenyl-diphosphatase
MPTALMQAFARIKNKTVKLISILLIVAISLFTVIGRILSGVHWITDIIGGILISSSLVLAYYSAIKRKSIDLYGNF